MQNRSTSSTRSVNIRNTCSTQEYPEYRTRKYCEYSQYILPKYCQYSQALQLTLPKQICSNSYSSDHLRMFSAKKWGMKLWKRCTDGPRILRTLSILRILRVFWYCEYSQYTQYQRTKYCQYLHYKQCRPLKILEEQRICTVSNPENLRVRKYPQY